jgi:hypothetical protein
MKGKRFSKEQIIRILPEAALVPFDAEQHVFCI